MARTLKKLAAPRRTIHFMWVPEYFGTIAYLTQHPDKRACTNANAGCVVANINMDMVGEDTVKTNGRFYMTRSPMSVPSFLDALLPDVLEQTREANLFAPSGSRNYWPASMTDYFQGSDHDLFLGINVPATMFGHDPDWTHHTSEDTPDKTDATEFRRVGVLASAATYWIASADAAQWQSLAPAVAAELMRVENARIVDLKRRGITRTAHAISLESAKLSTRGVFSGAPAPSAAQRYPRATTIPPLFSELTADWDPTINDLALFETVNYLNGTRSSAEIADLLTFEFGEKYDAAWVDRVVTFLKSKNLAQ
jgi:hypothetical protein